MDQIKTSADVLFILLGAIMVLAMHGGFAFLELGTVRKKNQVNALVKILVDFAFSTIDYFFVGYAVAYGTGFLVGAESLAAKNGYELVKFFFMLTFSAAIPTIISGAIAERARFGPQLIATAVLVGAVYPVFEGAVWKPLGRLWNNRFGSISTIRKYQLDYARGPNVTKWVIGQLSDKIVNQIDLLFCLLTLDEPHEKQIKDTVDQMRNVIEKMKNSADDHLDEAASRLRALEGQAAKLYFSCVNKHLPFRFQFYRTKQTSSARYGKCYAQLCLWNTVWAHRVCPDQIRSGSLHRLFSQG